MPENFRVKFTVPGQLDNENHQQSCQEGLGWQKHIEVQALCQFLKRYGKRNAENDEPENQLKAVKCNQQYEQPGRQCSHNVFLFGYKISKDKYIKDAQGINQPGPDKLIFQQAFRIQYIYDSR